MIKSLFIMYGTEMSGRPRMGKRSTAPLSACSCRSTAGSPSAFKEAGEIERNTCTKPQTSLSLLQLSLKCHFQKLRLECGVYLLLKPQGRAYTGLSDPLTAMKSKVCLRCPCLLAHAMGEKCFILWSQRWPPPFL